MNPDSKGQAITENGKTKPYAQIEIWNNERRIKYGEIWEGDTKVFRFPSETTDLSFLLFPERAMVDLTVQDYLR